MAHVSISIGIDIRGAWREGEGEVKGEEATDKAGMMMLSHVEALGRI